MHAAAGHRLLSKYSDYFVIFRHHAVRKKYGYTINAIVSENP